MAVGRSRASGLGSLSVWEWTTLAPLELAHRCATSRTFETRQPRDGDSIGFVPKCPDVSEIRDRRLLDRLGDRSPRSSLRNPSGNVSYPLGRKRAAAVARRWRREILSRSSFYGLISTFGTLIVMSFFVL